jgi:hypothetical protein
MDGTSDYLLVNFLDVDREEVLERKCERARPIIDQM